MTEGELSPISSSAAYSKTNKNVLNNEQKQISSPEDSKIIMVKRSNSFQASDSFRSNENPPIFASNCSVIGFDEKVLV